MIQHAFPQLRFPYVKGQESPPQHLDLRAWERTPSAEAQRLVYELLTELVIGSDK